MKYFYFLTFYFIWSVAMSLIEGAKAVDRDFGRGQHGEIKVFHFNLYSAAVGGTSIF